MAENDCSPIEKIPFVKYLSCPRCVESGLYCCEHRVEVEKILEGEEDGTF